MVDQEPVTGHSARLLRGLIWAGVLLAPLAAAVVLLGGSSNSVRFAVVLIAVSLVLIGASVLIRTDPVLQRMDVEDRVAEEIATLRRELRAEFSRGPDERYAAPIGPARPDPAFGAGGRASVPVAAAVAAVRRGPGPNLGGPGPNSGGMSPVPGGMAPVPGVGPGTASRGPQPGMAPPRRPTGPGLVSGARPPVQPPIPRQRGAATAPPPQVAPRAAGAARPAATRPGVARYGGAEALDADFGASNGYAGVNPEPTAANAYGAPVDDGFDQPDSVYGPAAEEGYEQAGQVSGDYPDDGYDETGHADDGYGDYPDDPEVGPGQPPTGQQAADAQYRARRHRPSANDTNIGTLADFASFDGYGEPLPDQRYGEPVPDAHYGDLPADGGYDDPVPDERYVDPPGQGGLGRRR